MSVPALPPSAARSLPAAVWRAVRSGRWTSVCAVLIVAIVLLAAAADLFVLAEGQSLTPDIGTLGPTGLPAGTLGGLSGAHWFGVEPLTGVDLFALVAHGARTSLLVGLGATALGTVLGVVAGVSAGYLGGWWDRVVTWTADVILGFPYLIFMIALGAVLPVDFPRQVTLIVVLGLFGWPRVARIVRAQTLSLAKRDFVAAARVVGAGPWHVFTKELLPNLWAPIIVVASLTVPSMIGNEAALSFLGVGVLPPTPSWGRTISAAIDFFETDPMYLVFPGLLLFLITLAFNVVGDALRDALDPRSGGAA
ncbi:ABC transporter permease [Amycolatopsis vancoresmycina]|uniref:ABC transporter inner membrane protein n=1 Tax=Amycolatopsis vancoresmycina DSM 44592 TaxID=1292037 RepID=R1G9J2_9PSEU|nr:ABC transporter permease [Amycolatopsis vancoresmycina]EOD68018.1 ABC transporter inner membrane protein [Amycolatopsis vancoresmycina DSM 44592]